MDFSMNHVVVIERTELLARAITNTQNSEKDKDIALLWISEITADLINARAKEASAA